MLFSLHIKKTEKKIRRLGVTRAIIFNGNLFLPLVTWGERS